MTDLCAATPEERRLAARDRYEAAHPELDRYQAAGLRGHALCSCGQPEPVDRNGEFLFSCPRRRID